MVVLTPPPTGGKMYNVTFIDGYLQELDSETKLGKFKRTSYGETPPTSPV